MKPAFLGPFVGGLAAVGVLVVDLTMSSGFAVGTIYVLPVALSALSRRPGYIGAMAGACTIFAIIGHVHLSPAAGDAASVTNRGLAIFAILVTSILALGYSRAKHVISKKEDIYQVMFNQTFQFVAALDSTGNITEANQTLRDYAGLTTDEIRSVPLWLLPIFQKDSDAEQRVKELVDRARSGNFSRDEFVVTGIGDQPTVIDFSLKPLRNRNGAIDQMIMEARDVTEARTQQEMLVQAQKMEAVGELTAGVAHDFNNLLTVVIGNLEILQKRLTDNSKAQDRLRRALDAATKGQGLNQQLLAFSRRQSLHPAVVDVNTLLQGMSQLYETLGDAIKLEFNLADDLPPCDVDPTLLETALLNIAINARDAMPDGGTLRFETAEIKFDDTYEGEVTDLAPGIYICIAITDSGKGIPDEIKPQVFEPFFTTKDEGQGTGLGLSMVYGFIKQSGGDVKIYSEVGEGTTVRIYLSATDKPLPKPKDVKSRASLRQPDEDMTILVVDDDAEVRDTIFSALTDLGYAVETAENGDAAIELIRAGKSYGLIFTDMVMAGEAGGPEVARAARAAIPGVPVIFCSGFPRQMLDKDEASVDGALFLPKPFQNEALVDIINQAKHRAIAND